MDDELCRSLCCCFSRNHADDMCWRDLEFLVDLGAKVLVQELLQFLVLLLQADSRIDCLASLLQKVVILLEEDIKSFPDTEVHVWNDVAHSLPELSLFSSSASL